MLGLETHRRAFDPLANRVGLVMLAFERSLYIARYRFEHCAGVVVELGRRGQLRAQTSQLSLQLFSRHDGSVDWAARFAADALILLHGECELGEQVMNGESDKTKRRRPPLLIVIGFLLAFAATVVTVLLTGLFVRAPSARGPGAETPPSVSTEPAPRQ